MKKEVTMGGGLDNPNYHKYFESDALDSTGTLKDFGYKTNKTGFSLGTNFEYLKDFKLGISSYVEKLETDSSASANMKKQKGSYFDTFFN